MKEITQTEISKAVKISNNDTYVDSNFVAKAFDKRHDNLISLIEDTIDSLLNFKESTTQYFKDSSYVNSRGKTYKRYELTRKGFDLIVLSFTGEKAFKYKVWFIDDFHEKAEILSQVKSNKQNSLLQVIRDETKPARVALTDAIEKYELPLRIAEGKIHESFLKTRIMNYTQLINSILDIKVPRDALEPRILYKLEEYEYKAAKLIKEFTEDKGCHYKQTYQLIKKNFLCK